MDKARVIDFQRNEIILINRLLGLLYSFLTVYSRLPINNYNSSTELDDNYKHMVNRVAVHCCILDREYI